MGTDTLKTRFAEADGPPMSVVDATPIVADTMSTSARQLDRLVTHRWALAAIAGLLAAFAVVGLPTQAETVVLLVAAVLLIDSVATKGVPGALTVARDWVPVALVLIAYKYSRGVADSLGMPLQLESLVDVERLLFNDTVPTVWLQERLIADRAAWWEGLTAVVYLSHFFASFVLLGVLHARSRTAWLRYLRRFITLNAMGVVTYVLMPAAPPWMAAEQGIIGAVERTTIRGIDVLGVKPAASLLANGQATTNDVAALPSLHAGYAFLVALTLIMLAGRTSWRWVLFTYPVAMGFTLVYSGEHYVVDLVLGFIYAAAAHVVWDRIEARRTSVA